MKEQVESTIVIDRQSVEQLKAVGKGFGWDPFIEEYCRGVTKMVHCEIAERAKQRAKILKMDKQFEENTKLEESYHNVSITHMKNASKLFKEANKKMDIEMKKKCDEELSKHPEGLENIQKEVMGSMKLLISESDIKPEDASEIAQAYDECFKHLKEKGLHGIVEKMDKDMDELIKMRSDKKKNRGREPRSPLALWKWFVIVGLIGLCIALIVWGAISGGKALWWATGGIAAVCVVLGLGPIVTTIIIQLDKTGC